MSSRRKKTGRSDEAVNKHVEYVNKLFHLIEEFMPTAHDLLFPDILDYAHLIEDCECKNEVERLDCLARFLEMITPMIGSEYKISVDVLLKLLGKAMEDMYDPFYDEFERWLESRFGTKDWQKVAYTDRREVVRFLRDTLFKYLKALDGDKLTVENGKLSDSGEKGEELSLLELPKSLRELKKRREQ
ncbi:MAG: hypothetical protein D6735_04970 [Acidobacteria bacterium]|nr:MAG: hypothetical protein D6735_04970 [Acidobacteriota bacterium]